MTLFNPENLPVKIICPKCGEEMKHFEDGVRYCPESDPLSFGAVYKPRILSHFECVNCGFSDKK